MPALTTSFSSRTLDERVQALFAGDAEANADPYPTWNELRETHPVRRIGGAVVFTRHADVQALLADNNTRYSRAKNRDSSRYQAARERFTDEERRAFDAVMDLEFRQLVRLDPPEHPRQRRQIQAAFAPRRLLREMQETVARHLDELLADATDEDGVADLKRLAYTLPLRVLGELLGIPLRDLDDVHGWAHVIGTNKFNADSGKKAIAAERAYQGLNGYIDQLVAEQRAADAPTGLLASLLEAQENGDLADEELRAMLALLIFAGHETTSNLLAIGMYELLLRPDQWGRLTADPALGGRAAEELLRFVTPALYVPYVAIEEHEVGGVAVHPGDSVVGVLASANRDPDVFDRPDELDIERDDARNHLALGHGPHYCVGAALARMEGEMFFEAMARRFPDARLVQDHLEWGGSGSLRTPLRLPVELQP